GRRRHRAGRVRRGIGVAQGVPLRCLRRLPHRVGDHDLGRGADHQAAGPSRGRGRDRLTDDALIASALSGDRRSVARIITRVESGAADAADLVGALYPSTGRGYTVGLTGSPGAGKSSITDRLISLVRAGGEEVGGLAFDPSSPFTGGAILGDRVRMQGHPTDDGVFIRSMA